MKVYNGGLYNKNLPEQHSKRKTNNLQWKHRILLLEDLVPEEKLTCVSYTQLAQIKGELRSLFTNTGAYTRSSQTQCRLMKENSAIRCTRRMALHRFQFVLAVCCNGPERSVDRSWAETSSVYYRRQHGCRLDYLANYRNDFLFLGSLDGPGREKSGGEKSGGGI